MLLLALLLCGGSARADEFRRPGHLRAVAEPPVDWADLVDRKRRVRLWWDAACKRAGLPERWTAWTGEQCATATVEELRGERWTAVAQAVGPGWTSRRVPHDTAFRVRLSTPSWTGRFSEPISAPPWHSPTDLARVGAPPGALLGARVGQISASASSSESWASTLGGGAARFAPASMQGQPWTRWEGLPDDRVVAIDQWGDRVLIGTSAGAALIVDGEVVRVWDQELPDPWVQAVSFSSDDVLWLGTYQGLARVQGEHIDTVLAPWSVFSLARAKQGGVWVGYDGVVHVAEDGVPSEGPDGRPGRLDGQHIYGLFEGSEQVFAASEETGLRRLDPDPTVPALPKTDDAGAYGVVETATGTWVARGSGGLQAPTGAVFTSTGQLPDSTVWSVADAGAGVWVGTGRGIGLVLSTGSGSRPPSVGRLPLAPWPADAPIRTGWVGRHGLWVAGSWGLTHAGRAHRAAGDLAIGARQPVVELLADGRAGAWAVGVDAVHVDRRGRLELVPIPGRATAAAVYDDSLWLGTTSGLWRQVDDHFVALTAQRGLTRLAAGPDALWAIVGQRVMRITGGAQRPYLQVGDALDLAVDPVRPGQVWIGTQTGLERLVTGGDQDGEVIDVLGDADAGVVVPAVAADGRGGCWMAAADGTVVHVFADGRELWTHLPEPDPPWPTRVVLDPREGGDVAWVFTERGTWRIRLAQ